MEMASTTSNDMDSILLTRVKVQKGNGKGKRFRKSEHPVSFKTVS
jgi:hypothetical protein